MEKVKLTKSFKGKFTKGVMEGVLLNNPNLNWARSVFPIKETLGRVFVEKPEFLISFDEVLKKWSIKEDKLNNYVKEEFIAKPFIFNGKGYFSRLRIFERLCIIAFLERCIGNKNEIKNALSKIQTSKDIDLLFKMTEAIAEKKCFTISNEDFVGLPFDQLTERVKNKEFLNKILRLLCYNDTPIKKINLERIAKSIYNLNYFKLIRPLERVRPDFKKSSKGYKLKTKTVFLNCINDSSKNK